MKKVLVIITTEFVPFGGLTTVMMNYYRAINKNRYIIDFASTNTNLDYDLQTEIEKNGSSYYCLGDRKHNQITYIRRLKELLRKQKYQIVHVNANSATACIELFTAKYAGVPIRIDHNHTSICDHKIIHSILYPFLKYSYTNAIACSDKAGEWIFNKNRYVVLNNGIDTQKYSYNEDDRNRIREQWNIDSSTTVVGHVGKIYKPKNHSFLIQIFAEYSKKNSNTKLFIVGDGELREQVKSLAKSLEIENKVIFAGMQTDIPAYLSAMDIFLFPSLWEGLPLSLIEAQASGLMCFASKNIDSTVNVTGEVIMLPIDKGASLWADSITENGLVDRKNTSNNYIKILKETGFDSRVNVEKLEQIYDR